jgi:hypothetical protein
MQTEAQSQADQVCGLVLQCDVKMRDFPKEDEVWWDTTWTDEMQLACTNILRKVKRNRSSTDFLEPVDHVGRA